MQSSSQDSGMLGPTTSYGLVDQNQMSSSTVIDFTRRQLWLRSIPACWKGKLPCQQYGKLMWACGGEWKLWQIWHMLASRWLENLNICLAQGKEASGGAGYPVGWQTLLRAMGLGPIWMISQNTENAIWWTLEHCSLQGGKSVKHSVV